MKKRRNLDQKNFSKLNDYEKSTKKEERKKRQPSKTPSFFFFLSCQQETEKHILPEGDMSGILVF